MSQIEDFLSDKPSSQPKSGGDIDSFLSDAPKSYGLKDFGGDLASVVAKGVMAVPQAAVGLADIATGGRAGKALEDAGVRFKEANQIADSWKSDALKAQQKEFQDAEGIGGKAVAALSNPGLIASTVAESIPSMFLGGALAKGAGMAIPALAGRAGLAAAGEGAVMAGSQAENIRQQTADGLLTPGQSALAAATGVAGGAIGALGAKAGKALGVGDIDTMIANGAAQGAREGVGLAGRVGRGALAEGVLEELPQSLTETAFGNIALDKPVTEGMDEAAVLGTLSGGLMGGVAGGLSRPAKPSQQMGIDPNAGPLSRAAASAVDSQPVPQPLGASITGTALADLMGRASDPLAAQIMERRQQEAADATPAQQSEPVPLEQRSLDELRQAFRSAQDPAIRKTLAAEIRKRREAMTDPLAQPQQEISLEPQATQAVQSQPQEAQAPAEPAVLGQPLTDTGTNMLGRGADPLQSIIQGQADARRATDELRGTTGASTVTGGDITPPSVESPLADVRSTGRNDDAGTAQPDANGVAGSAVGSAAEGSAALTPTNSLARDSSWIIRNKETGEVVMETFDKKKVDALNTQKYEAVPALEYLQGLNKKPEQPAPTTERPERWRTTAIKAGKVARSLGLDPKGKRLKEIVAEIDAVDAGTNVQNTPQGTAGEAKAPSVKESKAEGGNAASNAGVPAAPGAGDVQADGVKPEPFVHSGLKIGVRNIKMGEVVEQKWVVQSPENAEREARGERQIGGDSIQDTRELAIKAAEDAVARHAARKAQLAELDAKEKADRDAEEARKAANRGKSIGERKADATLDKQIRESSTGDVITRREWVERRVKDGLTTSVTQENKIKPMSRMQAFRADNRQQAEHDRKVKEAGKKDVYWLGDFEVTKTEYDYANRVAESKKEEAKKDAAPAANPKATELTPKQFHEAKLSFIAADSGADMAEVREMYDTEGGRAEHQREWLRDVEAAAKAGETLSRQTLDKLYELAPNARLPETAAPNGYQKPDARKAEAEEKQARIDNRKAAKESVKAEAAAQAETEQNKFAEYDALARQYGYEVRQDGSIGSNGKFPGVTMSVKKGRLRVEGKSGNLLGSYAPTPESLGKFLESFWYAEKKKAAAQAEKPAEDDAVISQTKTPAFQKWFGASKVVDGSGNPMVMYHGTSNSEGGNAFTMFDAYGSNYGLFGQGAYFTNDPEVASSYTSKGKGGTPTVYSAFMSIKNPVDMDAKADPAAWEAGYPDVDFETWLEDGDTNESYYRAAEEHYRDAGYEKWEGAEAMQDGLRRMGFDGITHIGGGRVKSEGVKHRVFIAFDPEQIKSATGNRGTFDPANPDITFAGIKDKAKRQGTPVDRAIMDMAGEGREANEILSFIAKSSKSPYRRQLAQKLLATGANPAVSLGGEMGGGAGFRFLAKYSRKNHEVTLSEAAADRAEQIFLHETVHAATLLALDKGGLIATQMNRLYESVKAQGGAEGQYGLKNVGEFVAEAFTNPDFQKSLKGMKADSGSLWDRFVNIVRRILGMEPRQQDALSKALELGAGVMRENIPLRAAKSFRAEDGPAFAGSMNAMPEDQAPGPQGDAQQGADTGKRVAEVKERTAIRDEAGLPLRLYHGSERSFSQFDIEEDQRGVGGVWFTDSKNYAYDMSRGGWDSRKRGAGGQIVHAYLDVRNPYEFDVLAEGIKLADDVGVDRPVDSLQAQELLSGGNGWDSFVGSLVDDAKRAGHDALVIKNFNDARMVDSTAYVVFDQKSIAIDRIETNDQSAPDSDGAYFGIADAVEQIGKQAAVKPVVQALNDTFKVRGKIHWWHKTVGTPFNLAERVPEFKRVFNSVQDFINSVSFYGAEAAAMAPKIIPKLESWKDLGKSPIKAEDNKAIATPIFEGTLAWMRDESGRPVKVADMQAAADKLSPDEKAQRLLRTRKISPEVLAMWRGLPLEQFQSNIETRYTSEMLRPGVVWKDSELRSLFKLTDEQIGLYREFRAATDKSLTDLAMSDILQFAGKDADPIKDQVMGMNLAEGSETVRDYLLSLADSDPDRRSDLIDTANAVIDKANRVQDLMDSGYAPLQRFGRFTVYAKDENGEQLFFGMYEDRWAAARAARQMREQYPGAKVETGMMSEEAYKMFQGISPETLEIFGTMLGMDSQADGETNKAFQTYLKLAKSNRSALKRLIERKGISGYSEDASRVLASFIYSNARQTASNLHVGEIMNGVNDIPSDMGEAKDAAVRLARYTMDPQEEAQALRGLLFAQYLGGSIASAAINALQPAQVTFPYLSQFVGAKKSASLMTGAVRDALKKSTGDPRLDAELKKAEEEGIVSPQEIFQLMAQAQGKATLKAGDGTKAGDAMAAASNTLSRLSLGWGKVFSIPEQFNRRTTFIAAYRTAKETGEANPYEFAKQAVKETQLVYNKGNRPEWARGTIGALAFTFKTYSISYVELLQRMAASGPEGRRAALLMVGVLFVMAGAGGLPGVEDAEDVVDGIAQRVFGLNFQTRQKRQEWLADTFGEGGARFIENGLSGLPWSPTDVSGRLGLGNLIPGTGLFVKKENYGRDVAEIAGPAADMTKRFLEGAGLLLQGEFLKAGEIVSPTAVRNMIQGGRMLATDQYTDTKGRKVIDTTPAEGITKLIGFQPADVARVQEATGTTQRMIALNKIRESEIADKWAKGLASGDADVVQEARDELRKWNESNPESPIRINMPQLFRRVRALKEDKATRIARTAPKEIRQDVRRALEQGQ